MQALEKSLVVCLGKPSQRLCEIFPQRPDHLVLIKILEVVHTGNCTDMKRETILCISTILLKLWKPNNATRLSTEFLYM